LCGAKGRDAEVNQIEDRTIGACLRPPRVAVAYRTRSDWIYSARQVVASLSRVWGGAGAVVMPVSDGGAAAQNLLPLLRAYDPDHVAMHAMTVADLAVEDPDIVDRLVKKFAYPGESRDETWTRVSKEPVGDGAWDALADQIDGWCSPFRGLRQEVRSFEQAEVSVLHREDQPGVDLSLLPAEPGEVVYTLDR